MPPPLRAGELEDVVVDPLDELEPDKFCLCGMRLAVDSENKTRTSVIKERLHLGRNTALCLDHQPNPVCESPPFNKFRHRGAKASGINPFELGLGLVARPSAESDLTFAVSSGHSHR